jgi:hypothetical protein
LGNRAWPGAGTDAELHGHTLDLLDAPDPEPVTPGLGDDMATSLYDLSVTNYLQILDAMSGFMGKAKAHFEENKVDLAEVVETRLFADMFPFRFQVQQVAFHSIGTVEALKVGSLAINPGERPQQDYAGLQALIADAAASLREIDPAELNAREGAEFVFEARGNKRHFTSEDFVMSFSLPNFHFHATTAYDILRVAGAPLGKMDYMGALRLKG